MNPEAIAAGFITAHHRGARAESEATPRAGDRVRDRPPVATRDRADDGSHTEAASHPEFPMLLAELKCHVEGRFVYTHLRADCCDHWSPPGWNLEGAYPRRPALIVSPLLRDSVLSSCQQQQVDTL